MRKLRKLIMWDLITLDGFFEGQKSWDIDWHNYAWGEELEKLATDQLKTVGALLFGTSDLRGHGELLVDAERRDCRFHEQPSQDCLFQNLAKS